MPGIVAGRRHFGDLLEPNRFPPPVQYPLTLDGASQKAQVMDEPFSIRGKEEA
jgi:hypothetical protein